MEIFKKNVDGYNVKFNLMPVSEGKSDPYYYEHFLKGVKDNEYTYIINFFSMDETVQKQGLYLKRLCMYFAGINVEVGEDYSSIFMPYTYCDKVLFHMKRNDEEGHYTNDADKKFIFGSNGINVDFYFPLNIFPYYGIPQQCNSHTVSIYLNEYNVCEHNMYPKIPGAYSTGHQLEGVKYVPKTYLDLPYTLNDYINANYLIIVDDKYMDVFKEYLNLVNNYFYKDIRILLQRQLTAQIYYAKEGAKTRELMDKDNIDGRSGHEEAIKNKIYHDDIIEKYKKKLDPNKIEIGDKRFVTKAESDQIEKSHKVMNQRLEKIYNELGNKTFKELVKLFYSNITGKKYYKGKLTGNESDKYYCNNEELSKKVNYTNFNELKTLHYKTDMRHGLYFSFDGHALRSTYANLKKMILRNDPEDATSIKNFKQNLAGNLMLNAIAYGVFGYDVKRFYETRVYFSPIQNQLFREALTIKPNGLSYYETTRPSILTLKEYKEKNNKQITLPEINAYKWDQKYEKKYMKLLKSINADNPILKNIIKQLEKQLDKEITRIKLKQED